VHEHYSDKLFELYLSISINIRHRNHLLDFFARKVTLQSLTYLFQLTLAKSLLALNVENFECLEQFFLSLRVF
jgi:hypothetical protein